MEGMTLVTTQPFRVYADTSVYGSVFDEEFAKPSRAFFEQIQGGRYRLVTCPLLEDELEDAPPQVRRWYQQFETAGERVAVVRNSSADRSDRAIREALLRRHHRLLDSR